MLKHFGSFTIGKKRLDYFNQFQMLDFLYDSIRVKIEYNITETPTMNKCVLKYAMNRFFTPYFRLMSVCRPSVSLIFKSLNTFWTRAVG